MKAEDVLKLLDKAQAKGAVAEIKLDSIEDYLKYKSEKNLDKKISFGISVVQTLINASNLDVAEKFLDEIQKFAKDNKKYFGPIFEKKGWIADCRDKWSDEIKYFKKAREFYEKFPEGLEIEGHKDDRLLTVEHFTGRALYFLGKKENLDECLELFSRSLKGYEELKAEDAIAFNYSWIARVYLEKDDLKRAEEMARKSVLFFEKSVEKSGKSILAYGFRIKAEISAAKGDDKGAVENALEALRYNLPEGIYYNGVIDAIKPIVKVIK